MTADVIVREVGLRDGLQLAKSFVPTETKIAWLEAAAAAGIGEVEVTNFVPAKVIAQFADAAEVASRALTVKGPKISALTPNRRGAENALNAGVRHINFVMSVSEGHNQSNVRKSCDQSFDEFRQIVELKASRPEWKGVVLQGCLATSFGCSIEGRVDPARVLGFVDRYLTLGADEITLADTVGYAGPSEIENVFHHAAKLVAGRPLYAHFHDTRGLGLANVYAALDAGCMAFDASTGGLGGCPFAPGATGNIVLEDTVFLLEKEGLRTGIDLERMKAVRAFVEAALPNETFHGGLARAGLPKGFVPAGRPAAAAE